MKQRRLILFMLIILILGMAAVGTGRAVLRVVAQPLADVFSISWWTVDNGGGVSQSGQYQVKGTAGQPDAGISSGGTYKLSGGFWSGAVFYVTRLPIVTRGGAP